ncbi:MAG: glycosyltransferase family 2 protein [Patescibacteria group bacterium]|nr:glycosyltransferase family 2 protein [Patescibacteria group bacterium]
MSVYNGEQYLKEAVDSILNQTFKNFEFLIINDGSTDRSLTILNSYKDRRIRIINNTKNMGLVFSLNKGIRLAKGEYIARMDVDDISHLKRLKKQVEFLDSHLDYGVVGTARLIINSQGKVIEIPSSIFDDEDIKVQIVFQNPLVHGSVMIRKFMLLSNKLFYNPKAKHFEDYDLWVKLINKTKMFNIPEILYYWRTHSDNITTNQSKVMYQGSEQISRFLTKNITLPRQNFKKILSYRKRSHLETSDKKLQSNIKKGYQIFLIKYALLSLRQKLIFNFLILLLSSLLIQPMSYFIYPFKIMKQSGVKLFK